MKSALAIISFGDRNLLFNLISGTRRRCLVREGVLADPDKKLARAVNDTRRRNPDRTLAPLSPGAPLTINECVRVKVLFQCHTNTAAKGPELCHPAFAVGIHAWGIRRHRRDG